MSMPRICSATSRASSADSATLIPPALPRPPTCTWALTTTLPPSPSAAAAASAGLEATRPSGTGTSKRLSSALPWYSNRSKKLCLLLVGNVFPHPADDRGRRGAGSEYLADARFLEGRDVLLGDDPASENVYLRGALLLEQPHDLREQRHVRPRETRKPDGVDVLLDRGGGDLLGRLVQARVDDLHPGVSQRSGDDLDAPVVAVEAGLCNQYSRSSGWQSKSPGQGIVTVGG